MHRHSGNLFFDIIKHLCTNSLKVLSFALSPYLSLTFSFPPRPSIHCCIPSSIPCSLTSLVLLASSLSIPPSIPLHSSLSSSSYHTLQPPLSSLYPCLCPYSSPFVPLALPLFLTLSSFLSLSLPLPPLLPHRVYGLQEVEDRGPSLSSAGKPKSSSPLLSQSLGFVC